MNYPGLSTTYAKWVQTYGTELAKFWLPYEWLDTAEKLDFPGLPQLPLCTGPLLHFQKAMRSGFRSWKCTAPFGGRVQGVPANLARKKNGNLCGLVVLWQQSGRRVFLRRPKTNARLLHAVGNRQLQRCSVAPGVSMKYATEPARLPGVVCTGAGGE